MGMIKVFRQGKGSFFEWRHENGKPLGRILNQGEGIFLEREFSTLEEARAFCESELEKDASPFFHLLQGNDIIDVVYDRDYHTSKDKRENRIYATVSLVVMLLLATGVSVLFMPFQVMLSHVLFIGGVGAFSLLLYSISGNWHAEHLVLVILVLIMLSIAVLIWSE